MTDRPKYDRIMTAGADLLSEEGENAEYDRAIVELVSDLIGVCHEERGQTLATLRGLKGRS